MNKKVPCIYCGDKKKIFINNSYGLYFLIDDKGRRYSTQTKWVKNLYDIWYFKTEEEAVKVARFLAKEKKQEIYKNGK